MKYFKKLVGERIYLSPMNADDVEIYTRWMNDRKVTDGIGNTAHLFGLEEETRFLEGDHEGYLFAVIRSEDDQLIGNCGIQRINWIHRRAEVGLFIGEEKNRNRGYGAEILQLLLEYGFQFLNLHNIALNVYTFNERAIACYRKSGFREVGRRHEVYFLDGQYHDQLIMEVLEEEYRSRGEKA